MVYGLGLGFKALNPKPFVLCSSSFLGLGVAFLPFAAVGHFGLIGVCLILGVIF